jgi:hypothetical protein
MWLNADSSPESAARGCTAARVRRQNRTERATVTQQRRRGVNKPCTSFGRADHAERDKAIEISVDPLFAERGSRPRLLRQRSTPLCSGFVDRSARRLRRTVCDARRHEASRCVARTADVSGMCPRVQRTDNTKCRFAGTLGKPSDGLEPSTPSLPWRFQEGRRVPRNRHLALFPASTPFSLLCSPLPRSSLNDPENSLTYPQDLSSPRTGVPPWKGATLQCPNEAGTSGLIGRSPTRARPAELGDRACSSAGRRRLPTWSARKGELVRTLTCRRPLRPAAR